MSIPTTGSEAESEVKASTVCAEKPRARAAHEDPVPSHSTTEPANMPEMKLR
jgi:hypothetical protein